MASNPDRIIPIDREKLIDHVHALQVDLVLLSQWLAQESEPVLTEYAVWLLGNISPELQRITPSVRRH